DPAVTASLTQFVHLLAEDGTAYPLYDGEPFDGRFPLADWPGDVTLHDDAVTVSLPPDLPPGEYRVLTGLYDVATVIRVPVVDGVGRAVPDNSIPLGTVRVE
ncbi:MAG: hypothetical protein JW910_03920, partial [Anaerolineae bacterium]|nr:hypothetical protein [Anaerolineae bacterium]